MKKIDTSNWKAYVIGNLMDKLDLKVLKEDFDKRIDTSCEKDAEFTLPLINAKDGNNGIMYYGREADFESESMCLGIVQNGAIATGNVYAQIQKTGVLWDAYLVKPKVAISSYTLLFLSKILQKTIKEKYSYDNKAIWDKVKKDSILLPSNSDGEPDWEYMDLYMRRLENRSKSIVNNFAKIFRGKSLNIREWDTFYVGDLFKIFKPTVYHTHNVKEVPNGIPYIIRSKFNNGMKYRVDKQRLSVLNPAGVISFGAENAFFFYQAEEWCSGRDIYYIDTQHLTRHTCMFLLSCLQKITLMYSYNYGLFPDLLKQEAIRLPVTSKGVPNWDYMDNYMKNTELKANKFMNFVGEIRMLDL